MTTHTITITDAQRKTLKELVHWAATSDCISEEEVEVLEHFLATPVPITVPEGIEQGDYLTRADLMKHESFADLEKDSEGNPCVWLNQYRCDCGEEWDSPWSCQCDDECGRCGKDRSPDESDWLGPNDRDALALWENLPEAGSEEGNAEEKAARLPKFSVILTRNVTESAIVQVSAEDESSANTEAMRMDHAALTWAVDDGNVWEPPYITGTEEA